VTLQQGESFKERGKGKDRSMTRYGMVVDITRCNGCYNCFLACRDEYCGNEFPPYSASQPHTGHYWMRVVEKERGQYPKMKVAYTAIPCMHCDKPQCVEVSQAGVEPRAIYKRDDGIVLIDPDKAAGRKDLLSSCPYRVIFWNAEKELPQKCTFCAHLLDRGWKEPRCVEACPTRALVFGDLDDPASDVAQLVASGKTEPLRAEYEMEDKVTYMALPKRFVAGTVVLADTDRCGEGAEITLEVAGRVAANAVLGSRLADNYGDFEFEDLAPDVMYLVTVTAPGYETRQLTARTQQDIYLGEITLVRSGTGTGLGARAGEVPMDGGGH
jgi:Fe-S-cluster-containing dehydrogenase component